LGNGAAFTEANVDGDNTVNGKEGVSLCLQLTVSIANVGIFDVVLPEP